MKQKTKTEQFIHSILDLELDKSKALTNLVMGLSSQAFADSVTSISLSRCYHYQYSSISKALAGVFASGGLSLEEISSSRLEVEKNFVVKRGSFFEAFREVLALEYR